MAKWIVADIAENTLENDSLVGKKIHPLVANILLSRGLKNEKDLEQFIFPNYETDSPDPFLFCDMQKAVDRIKKALDEKERVIIFGDYDADGITSSAILKETLDLLGVDCEVYIPNKRTEGYSMNSGAVEMFAEKKVKLVITVDCGITSIAEVEKAEEMGIDVIITDHHHVPQQVPQAFAIINPHQENCGYPFADLAGVGVAFKLVQAIFEKLLPEKKQLSKWMLDLVAIGTIADCVPLAGENRLFVKYGLMVLSKTRRVGLHEMFAVGGIIVDENSVPDTKKVSFYIAPRINAAGRIDHANLAYNLIVEKNNARARVFALELEASNTERQKVTQKIVDEVKILAENSFKDKKFIFAVGEHFPIGVVGLVAGKIAQQFNKPTVIFQKSEIESKGSFRSIPQVNIIETIGQCKEFLVRHGGHSQAAGVTVKNEDLEKFYEKMNLLINQKLEGIDLGIEIRIDGEVSGSDVDFDLVEDLERLMPFGEGNAEPILAMRNLIVQEKRVLGNGEKHIKLFLAPTDGCPKIFEAVSFNGYEKYGHVLAGSKVDIACNIQKDQWNGNEKIQLMIVDLKVL